MKSDKSRSICLLFFLLTLLVLSLCTGNEALGQSSTGGYSVNKSYNTAGMKLQVNRTANSGTTDSNLNIPMVKNSYIHPFKANVHPTSGNLLSAASRKPFTMEDNGFRITVKSCIWDSKANLFTGHGTITAPSITSTLYAQEISFNKNGISKIDGLRSRGGWKVAGLDFSPEKIEWTKDGIRAQGLLSLKSVHPDISILADAKGITIEKLIDAAYCLIDKQTAVITGMTMKQGRIYISGYSSRFSADQKKPYLFKDIPVDSNGKISAKLPRFERPKLPPNPYIKERIEKKKKQAGLYENFGEIISGFAGLPGEILIQVAKSNMTVRVTSPNKAEDPTYWTGYINLPEPFKRANVSNIKNNGKSADISGSSISWHKKKVTIPIINCIVETRTPVRFEDGKLNSPLFGKLKILELTPESDKVFADASRIDYTVKPFNFPGVSFNSKQGCISPIIGTTDCSILFDVIQGEGWMGFKFQGNLPGINYSSANMPWFGGGSMAAPSIFWEHHSTGYMKFDLTTGYTVSIPIIPDALNLVAPEIHIFRYPVINYTEVWFKGNFQPPPPVVGGKIFRMVGTFYVDVNGMSSCPGPGQTETGSKMRFELFTAHVGDVTSDLDGRNKVYTCEGSIGVCGFDLFDNTFQIHLTGGDFIKGSSSIRITYYIPWYKPPFYKKEHKDIGIKYSISKGGHFSFGLGSYHFHTHDAGGDATYDGDFTADGIQYNGHLVLTPGKDINLNGSCSKSAIVSSSDSMDYSLVIQGTMDDAGIVDSGSITAKSIALKLNPGIPQSPQPVEIDLSITPTFTKDLQSGLWQTPSQKVQVDFTYTDKDGKTQKFSKECDFRIYLNNSIVHLDLDLPPDMGGTYSQSFDLGS